jgi:AraC-like DNA-binding protein
MTLPARAVEGQPTARVSRYRAGDISEPMQAPTGAVALRFPFGVCRMSVMTNHAWGYRGEAAAGYVHAAPTGQTVRTEWLSDGEEIVFIVPHTCWRDAVTQRMRDFLAKGVPRQHRDPVLQQLVQLLLQAALENVDGPFTAPLIDTVLMRAAMACADHLPRASRRRRHQALPAYRIARIKGYVQEHLSGPMTLQDMASAVGMSPMHFAAQFRAATGKRPHDYLLEQRIHRAKELMEGTRFSLYDVALAVGFNTQAHFGTVFRRFVGVTPSQWRSRFSEAA